MTILQLLWSFFQIGLFSIGGGYAAMPLIQAQTVTQHAWLTMNEFADLVTIAEMTPGPIAINAATFVGIRVAGLPGAVAASIGCVLPSCVIVSLLAFVYFKFSGLATLQSILRSLRPAVVALIASAGVSILLQVAFSGAQPHMENLNLPGLALFAAAFFVLRKFKRSPILVMLCCGAAGLVLGLLEL